MKYSITDQGNLILSLEAEEDRERLIELKNDKRWNDLFVLEDILDLNGWRENGNLYRVRPEWIAALTDAPILTDDLVYPDHGDPRVVGRLWWYPNYAIEHFAEVLLEKGFVVFDKAPESTT